MRTAAEIMLEADKAMLDLYGELDKFHILIGEAARRMEGLMIELRQASD